MMCLLILALLWGGEISPSGGPTTYLPPALIIDVLANDVGNIGKILSFSDYSFYPWGLKISDDGKSFNFDPLRVGDSPLIFTFDYTAEDLDTGGTVTASVSVDITPTTITSYHETFYYFDEVSRGIDDIGRTVAQTNGIREEYFALNQYVAVTAADFTWFLRTSGEYVDGVQEGAYMFYYSKYESNDSGDLIRVVSTCATEVGQYVDGSRSGTWTNYWSSFTTVGTPCEVSSSCTYYEAGGQCK